VARVEVLLVRDDCSPGLGQIDDTRTNRFDTKHISSDVKDKAVSNMRYCDHIQLPLVVPGS
jgi:hypothetical protein